MINKYKKAVFGRGSWRAGITVGVSLHNYGQFIIDALDSVAAQTFERLSLIVVDDGSTDNGPKRTLHWLQLHEHRFMRAVFVSRERNHGLAEARNLALELTQTPFHFVLDADNLLYPRCLERLSAALKSDRNAAMAYPLIEVFGDECGLMGTAVWSRERLEHGNYIDAMSLIRTARLREIGGYAMMSVTGWEDYDLWCRFVEHGWYGIRVPELLARYRVHGGSMLNTITRRKKNASKIVNEMKMRHPWLRLKLET